MSKGGKPHTVLESSFRCKITRHHVNTTMCLARRANPKLYPKCKNCTRPIRRAKIKPKEA